MWGKGSSEGRPVKRAKNSDSITLIAEGTSIEGNIDFNGTVHVEGIVRGDITSCDGTLELIPGGCVEGSIDALQVIVNGRVHGDVRATKRLELASQAQIEGDVRYEVMQMTAGAVVNGKMECMHVAEECAKLLEQKTGDNIIQLEST